MMRYRGPKTKVPVFLASLLFSCHPIHTEPVSCVVGRSDILCGFFFLVALLSHERGVSKVATNWKLFLASLLFGLLAALSKELGVTVFGIFISHEIIMALSPPTRRRKGSFAEDEEKLKSKSKSNINSAPMCRGEAVQYETIQNVGKKIARHFTSTHAAIRTIFNLALPGAIVALHVWLHGAHKMYKWSILENDISLLEEKSHRVMSYMHVHSMYLWKLLNPFSLCYDYGWACIPPVVSLFDYRNVISVGVYALILSFGVYGAVAMEGMYLWAGALTVVPFLPASNLFFPIGTILGERLLYLPSAGFCMGLPLLFWDAILAATATTDIAGGGKDATAVVRTGKRGKGGGKKRGSRVLSRAFTIFWVAGVAPIAGVCCYKCVSRGLEWKDERKLFESAMQVCPKSLKVLNNLALVLLDKETAPRAGALLDEALALYPNYPSALFNRGLVHFVLQEDNLAIERFEQSLAIDVSQPKTRAYLAQSQLNVAFDKQKRGEWDKAKLLLRESLQQADAAIEQGCHLPMVFQVRCSVGHELKLSGEESLSYCDTAIQLNEAKESRGDDPNELIKVENSHNAAALILRSLGRFDEAAERYRLGLAANPDSFELLVNAGGLLGDVGKHKEAMEYYSRALSFDPNSPELITNIGWLLELQGHLHDARGHYVKALELLKPHSHPQIVNNLRNIEVRIEQQMGDTVGREGGEEL